VTRALAALLVAALFGACGGEKSGAPPVPSGQTVAPATAPAPAPATAPAPAPATAPAPALAPAPPATTAPAGNLRGNAEAGKALYAQYCATCHGAGGKGDGPISGTLNPRPANHTDHVFMGSLSDEHLYQVISKGGASVGKSAMMAPWGGVINDQGIRDLIAFLRELSST
jgi:mono/diheme cytochrome c family protein